MGTEARIYELEERTIEMPQSEQQRENTLKKKFTKSLKDKWGYNKRYKISEGKKMSSQPAT